ncbi:Nucleoside-diphosphate-sugar epimerase [Candidatus Kryptonium thompsonii]|uniref:Nucleoside-diphosphate-sugar epimerase n=2 Tax=Candidatus Kryptonium thompsonii TaxID=1633631 RepID=A0A0P1P8A1_9BACT|nr:NAD-dependent epimerase/dehydratase family protein [Candidatus Kryptonium thompsoni]CUS77325.1 Nucleoside-diphosphate-sugar epimerase [Candidatus Kryptonium thompsoni]CUS78909.1 Nucleoside-diphosphate-sugar epimerase [Candidatus Kryptonium thompsoni]CUS79903.1 Nucleoside-diphosphate-sugar epimerase [Candidatus Kryptonium thompsoni]CUS86268.1 Nucleoside-diphosphate-sugar epimerase [Candidatus Kryptonium thompsoni]CUS93346.1 Nucleoside-diphosphate-sugar epimerase [Candidatus Kryptonium thomps
MKALVTGGTGFIGSHLVDELLNRGYEVRCIVRDTSNLKWLNGKDVEIFKGSLFDIDFLKKAVEDVDYVYHIAGVTKGKNYQDYYRGNVETTQNLLEACLENQKLKKFVLASSLAAVGPGDDAIPVDETRQYNPITSYGKSKAEAEKVTLSFKDKLPITIVRPPSVYGPRDTYTFELFKYVKFGFLPVVLSDDQILSLVYVSDLVDGFILAGENEQATGEIYFISSEKIYTWKEIEEAVLKALDKKVFRIKIPAPILYSVSFISELIFKLQKKASPLNLEKIKDVRQKNWACSIEKAKKELGYTPKVSLEEGMRITINWYVENKWL